MKEEWVICKVTPKNTWEISNYGRLKKNGELVELKNFINTGYYYDASRSEVLIHRLIAKTFIPNPDNKPCIDHIDGNKHNNRVDNLRWVTYSENMKNPVTNKVLRNSIKKWLSDKTHHPMYGKHHTPEHTKHQSEAQKGRIAWNKGMHGVQTSCNKNRKYMNNGVIGIWVLHDEINKYLSNGWQLGRIKK